jgi:8-oxo-dGTP diphosphatase
LTDRFAVVPAVYVFLLRPAPVPGRREVLLQLRSGTGYLDDHWAAGAAGHVERGESVLVAARREAAEEIGVGDLALQSWCTMQRTAPGDDPLDERVDYFFVSTSWSGTPRLLEPDRSADLRWFDLDALPAPVVPHELTVLESVRARSCPAILVHGF